MQNRESMFVELGGRTYEVAADHAYFASFWKNAEAGQWEEETFRFLDAVADPQATMVDIGAWIGPIALYASPRVKRILALEPEAVAHDSLTANVAANAPNVEVWNVAIDNQEGSQTLYPTPWYGLSSNPDFSTGAPQVTIKTTTFARVEAAVGDAEKMIVKMDIEGHEFQVMHGLIDFVVKHRAATHLSLHPRAVWFEAKKGLKGRQEAFAKSMDAIRGLSRVGPVIMSQSGRPAHWTIIWALIFLRGRPKNFSVEVRMPIAA